MLTTDEQPFGCFSSMARQSVSKHLAVLEAAGLVTTKRRGRMHPRRRPTHRYALLPQP
jgi:DNA-binding transcriptional ArsR family regulator